MATFSNILGAKKSNLSLNYFICETCDFKCCKKFNYDRHILSAKHIKATISNVSATKKEQNEQNEQKYCCENCGKEYNDRSGLWRHEKNCKTKEDSQSQPQEIKKDEISDKELMLALIKDSSEQ